MSLARAVLKRFPGAQLGDFEIVQQLGGELVLERWEVTQDDQPTPAPTIEEMQTWAEDLSEAEASAPLRTAPLTPLLRAKLAEQQTINRYAYTRVAWDALEAQGLSLQDGVLTFSEAGVYLVLARLRVDASKASTRSFACRARLNGSFDEWIFNEPMYSSRRYKKWQKLMRVSAGDTLDFEIVHAIDGTISLNPLYQFLEGVKIL